MAQETYWFVIISRGVSYEKILVSTNRKNANDSNDFIYFVTKDCFSNLLPESTSHFIAILIMLSSILSYDIKKKSG